MFDSRAHQWLLKACTSALVALTLANAPHALAQSAEAKAEEDAEEDTKDDQDADESPPTLLSLPLVPPSDTGTEPRKEGKAEADSVTPPATSAKPNKGAPLGGVPSSAPSDDDAEPDEKRGRDSEAVGFTAPGDPWGDTQGLGLISLRALMQFRYASTFASKSGHSLSTGREKEEFLAEKNDGYSMKRILIRFSSDPVKYIGFKSVFDFSELMTGDVEDVVKQAYVVLRPIPERLEVVAGLFKTPFAILELDPSSRFELADLGHTNKLINDLGYAGRDLGVMASVAPLKKARKMRISGGAFRGHAYGEHDSPAGSLAGRIEYKPKRWLRFGGGVTQMMSDYSYNRVFNTSGKNVLPNPPDLRYPRQKNWGKGRAWGVDARIKKKGFMLRGEFIMGDRIDLDERYGAKTFWSAWGLAAYRIDIGSVKLLPSVRTEWLDSDREHKSGMWRTLSFGITTIVLDRLRFLVDVTRTDVGTGSPLLNQPKPLTDPPYLALDCTRVTAQMQIEL